MNRTVRDSRITDRSKVIEAAEAHFGLRIISFSNYRPTFLRGSATAHSIKNTDLSNINNDVFFSVRDWFEQNGWLLTRQVSRSELLNGIEYHFLAPLEILTIHTVFHATRLASLNSIMANGLRPATQDMCNFDRLDSLGYIYASEALGQPGDYAKANFGTAHWWAELFASKNLHDDQEWCILQVDLTGAEDVICFNDIWSRTGVILRPNHVVDVTRIQRVA